MTTRFKYLFNLLLAATLVPQWAATARGDGNEVLAGITPEPLVAALEAAGAEGFRVSRTGEEELQIAAQWIDTEFVVLLSDCRNGCREIRFRVTMPNEEMGPDVLNTVMWEWNYDQKFGKAYVDADGNLVLEHAIYVFGGITRDNLDANADLWTRLVDRFVLVVL